ncbi:MAG: monofunctional biosynthetic peptidoglycan transglycosylase [Balneolaceae bacterium]|nr:monofunctional biosynthetic peptidoglycan transglycosylase [Balneolaceae bacterium]MCH8550202.1 monofunctional biosynthetic peptidoglycan transglycosylase [Balneolaceae bacterium]
MQNREHSLDQPKAGSRPPYTRLSFWFKLVAGIAGALFVALILSVVLLRWVNPSATGFTLQADWDELPGERYNLREYWVDYDEIPDHLTWAVVAAEDQLFWEHSGFDIESIKLAWEEIQTGKRVRGASTISQQVAKNIYLTPAQSMLRKGVEAGITILIELFWPKERIIEVYLNIAEFGPGVFGVGKASQDFFERLAANLEPEMSARLAAVLPSPKRMRVNPPSPFAEERSKWILRQMTQLSGIAYYTPPEDEAQEFEPGIDPMEINPEFLEDGGQFNGFQRDTTADTTSYPDEFDDILLDLDPLEPLEPLPTDTTPLQPPPF